MCFDNTLIVLIADAVGKFNTNKYRGANAISYQFKFNTFFLLLQIKLFSDQENYTENAIPQIQFLRDFLLINILDRVYKTVGHDQKNRHLYSER